MPNWPAVKMIDATIGVDIHHTPLTAVETHRVQSLLQQIGLSGAGARQFALGQLVTNTTDRLRLARLLSKILAPAR